MAKATTNRPAGYRAQVSATAKGLRLALIDVDTGTSPYGAGIWAPDVHELIRRARACGEAVAEIEQYGRSYGAGGAAPTSPAPTSPAPATADVATMVAAAVRDALASLRADVQRPNVASALDAAMGSRNVATGSARNGGR